MELKIFRDTLPQGGAGCTVKAELPLETEIRISDDLPPVGKLVKCFVHPVVLQRQLQPGRLTLEGYLRCTVFYQSEAEKGLCQTEQKAALHPAAGTAGAGFYRMDSRGGRADRVPQHPRGRPAPY